MYLYYSLKQQFVSLVTLVDLNMSLTQLPVTCLLKICVYCLGVGSMDSRRL